MREVYLHVTDLHVAELFHMAKKLRDPLNKKENEKVGK